MRTEVSRQGLDNKLLLKIEAENELEGIALEAWLAEWNDGHPFMQVDTHGNGDRR